MATKKSKKPALFTGFPEKLYVVHVDEDELGGGYYLSFADMKEGAESAIENNSQLAVYEITNQGVARIDYIVEID